MPDPAQPTVEELAKQQQINMMQAAHIQFVSIVTMNPQPSKMPSDVRKYMWEQLGKTRGLFAPRDEEEQALYGI